MSVECNSTVIDGHNSLFVCMDDALSLFMYDIDDTDCSMDVVGTISPGPCIEVSFGTFRNGRPSSIARTNSSHFLKQMLLLVRRWRGEAGGEGRRYQQPFFAFSLIFLRRM